MFDRVLPKGTKKYLAILAKEKILPEKTYLGGGTAIALQLGHRISFDLDFFTPNEFNTDFVLANFRKIKEFKADRIDWGTILGHFSGCKFSLFYYPYRLLDKTSNFEGIEIASLKDLIASKISAISSRGTMRDFVDIYYLLKSGKFGMVKEFLSYYEKRFGNLASQKAHILKSLTYFADAEIDKDPHMLTGDFSWQKIKKFIENEVKEYVKSQV